MFSCAEKKAGNSVYTYKINEVTIQLTIGSSKAQLSAIKGNTVKTTTTLKDVGEYLRTADDIPFFLTLLNVIVDDSTIDKSTREEIYDLIKNDTAEAISAPSKLPSDDALRTHWEEYSPALQNFIRERLDSKQTNAEQVLEGFCTDDYEDQIDQNDFSIIEIPVRIPPGKNVMDLRSLQNYISQLPESKEPEKFKHPFLDSYVTSADIEPARDLQRQFERAITEYKAYRANTAGLTVDPREGPKYSKRLLPLTLLILITGGSVFAALKYPQETSNFFKPVKDALMSPTPLADLPVIGVVGIALAGLAVTALAYYFHTHPCPEPIRGLSL